jgi:hypothetical protein
MKSIPFGTVCDMTIDISHEDGMIDTKHVADYKLAKEFSQQP